MFMISTGRKNRLSGTGECSQLLPKNFNGKISILSRKKSRLEIRSRKDKRGFDPIS
jgi:hypothetical protein